MWTGKLLISAAGHGLCFSRMLLKDVILPIFSIVPLPNLQICEHNNMLFYGLKYEGACFTAADNHSCHSSLVPEIQGIRKPTFYILIRHLTLLQTTTPDV